MVGYTDVNRLVLVTFNGITMLEFQDQTFKINKANKIIVTILFDQMDHIYISHNKIPYISVIIN